MKRKITNGCLIIALSLSLILPVSVTASPNEAALDQTGLDAALEQAAAEYITKTITESGTDYIAVYQNLDGFIRYVQNEMPDVSDLELASFLHTYTNPEHPRYLPEETLLEILSLSELAVSTQAMTVNPATSEYVLDADAEGGDEVQKQIITCGRLADAPNHYIMDVTIRGLPFSFLPRIHTLALSSAVSFDANYEMLGYFHQIVKTAEREQTRALQVSTSEPMQEDLTLQLPKKDTFTPSISFHVKAASATEVYLRGQAQILEPGASFHLEAELSQRLEVPPLFYALVLLALACLVYILVRKRRGEDTSARRL